MRALKDPIFLMHPKKEGRFGDKYPVEKSHFGIKGWTIVR
jgi:hypothetical protein